MLVSFAACSWHSRQPGPLAGLATRVADLQLHLRDDPYRSFAHVLPDGRNVFEVALWQLERAQRERPSDLTEWVADDAIVEFVRSQTLERLHRYNAAADGYLRVASTSSRLAARAAHAAEIAARFAAQAQPATAPDSFANLAQIDAQIARWTAMADEMEGDPHAALAREEAESWEMRRVDFYAHDGGEAAIDACTRLLERHRASKLYPRHLLRLGDLHSDYLRRDVVQARADRVALAETLYERHLQAALSAYELASEARNTALRGEAQGRIQSLLAYNDGVRSNVY